jgi:hypothetical protein
MEGEHYGISSKTAKFIIKEVGIAVVCIEGLTGSRR